MVCSKKISKLDDCTSVSSTDDGGAMLDGRKWYIAIVQTNCERKVLSALERRGIEAFVPVQRVIKTCQGKQKEVEQVVLRSRVFVRIYPDSSSRTSIKKTIYVKKFVCYPGTYEDAIIPDSQIRLFQYMLGVLTEKIIFTGDLKLGSKVRVVRGALCGLEGRICELNMKNHVCVGIHMDILGIACVRVNLNDLEVLE